MWQGAMKLGGRACSGVASMHVARRASDAPGVSSSHAVPPTVILLAIGDHMRSDGGRVAGVWRRGVG